jgi:hypothetical protein
MGGFDLYHVFIMSIKFFHFSFISAFSFLPLLPFPSLPSFLLFLSLLICCVFLFHSFSTFFRNCFLLFPFFPERDEVTGDWRKMYSGELHNLYSSPHIIRHIRSRRMRWAGHVARMGEGRKVYRVLVGKPEGKRPLERPRRRWADGIKVDVREIGWGGGGVEWIRMAQDRDLWRAVVNAVMNLRVLASRS